MASLYVHNEGVTGLSDNPDQSLKPRPTSWQLFWNLALVGLCGFGGVLPWARRRLVDRRGWLSEWEFAELLALGQLMPGPNIANLVVIYARRQRGARGAISAISGLYIFPTMITILLGSLYARWGRIPVVEQMFGAIMPIAAGLVIGTALRLGRSLPATAHTFIFIFLAFCMMALLAWPLWLVLVLLAPASLMIAWRRAHHDAGRPS